MRAGLDGLIEDLPRPETDALARALPRVEALLSGRRRRGDRRHRGRHAAGPRAARR